MEKINFKNLGLDSSVLEAIEDCGYTTCTPTQTSVLPALLDGGNFLIQAATGTGKTAAFCIPLIQNLSFETLHPTALILAPTRELAHQIQQEFNRLGLYKKIHCVCCVGKEEMQPQILQLRQRAHVVVGTPGRILDLHDLGHLDLSKIETLVLDEATELISLGLLEQVDDISQEMNPSETWLFSATLEDSALFDFLEMKDPIRIEGQQTLQVHHQVDSHFFEVNDLEDGLEDLLDYVPMESAFIFTNTQAEADDVYRFLKKKGLLCSLLHGGLHQKKRTQALASFKAGSTCLLVATNVAARGVDVDNVSCVIHYRCPFDKDSYIHRSGRVGRSSFTGLSIVLSDFDDPSSLKKQLQAETPAFQLPKHRAHNHLNKPLYREKKETLFNEKNSTLFIRAGKKDKVRSNDIVGALCSIDGLEKDDIGIINIQSTFTTVTLLNKPISSLPSFDNFSIKGKRRKVELKKSK